MTTFVIRRPITRTQRRAEVARRLPVDAEIMICAGREIIGLFGVPATTRHRNTITAIARVLGKGGAWSTGEPSWAAAQQTFAAVSRSIVCVLRAPYFIRLQLHGSRSTSVCHPRTETVTMSRAEHWEHVYQTMGSDQVSWFQAEARLSRQLIETLAPARSSAIIDIGGGASTLVDGLLGAGCGALTVLDLSPAALLLARERLGARATRVEWQAADVLEAPVPTHAFDVWHDRAVFHFLTADVDRRRYVEQVQRAVRPGGLVLVATFAKDGPFRCSGLDVARYSPTQLHAEFGAPFALLESHRELHTTPSGAAQAFTYCACRVRTTGRPQAAA